MPIIEDIFNYEVNNPELYINKNVINLIQYLIENRLTSFQPKLYQAAIKRWPDVPIGVSPEQSPRIQTNINNISNINIPGSYNSTGKELKGSNYNNQHEQVLLGILVCIYDNDSQMLDKYGDFYPLETQGTKIYNLQNPQWRIKTKQFNVDLSFQNVNIQALPGTPIAVKGFFSSDLKNFTVTDITYPNEIVKVEKQEIKASVAQNSELLALKSKLPRDAIAFKALLIRLNVKSLIINKLQNQFGDEGQKQLDDVQQLPESGFTDLGFDTTLQDIIVAGILQVCPRVVLLPGPDDCTGESYPQDQFLSVLYENTFKANGEFGQNPFIATIFGKRAIIMDGLLPEHFDEEQIAISIVQSDHALVSGGVLFDYINTNEEFLYLQENRIEIIIYLGAPNDKYYNIALSDGREIKIMFIHDVGLLDNEYNLCCGALDRKQ